MHDSSAKCELRSRMSANQCSWWQTGRIHGWFVPLLGHVQGFVTASSPCLRAERYKVSFLLRDRKLTLCASCTVVRVCSSRLSRSLRLSTIFTSELLPGCSFDTRSLVHAHAANHVFLPVSRASPSATNHARRSLIG